MRTIDLNLNPGEPKNIQNYKEKASKLFEKLNTLQQNGEVYNSLKQKQLLNEFSNIERKNFEESKLKEGWYSKIIGLVQGIQSQLAEQRNQQQKCQRAMRSWIQSTQRQISLAFERFEKQRLRSEINFDKLVDNKMDSLILKNKSVWNSESLIKDGLFIEQIEYLQKDYRRFLGEYKKQIDKLKKQTTDTVKQYKKIIQDEINNNQQDKIILFMKAVHQQINNKIAHLQQQREKTQEKVLSVLQKIVQSCLNQVKK